MAEEKCPGCEVVMDAADLCGQMTHMTERHPEIIELRLAEAARWDGWEDD